MQPTIQDRLVVGYELSLAQRVCEANGVCVRALAPDGDEAIQGPLRVIRQVFANDGTTVLTCARENWGDCGDGKERSNR